MRWTVRNGFVMKEDGQIVAVLPEEGDVFNEHIIEAAPEACEAIRNFIDDINSGSFKPKASAKIFQKIIDKYEI